MRKTFSPLICWDFHFRTIIHTNKNLPELTCAEFEKLNLTSFSWIHFEGRNLEQVKLMMRHVKKTFPRLTVSVEVEKINRNFEELIPFGDVVFISKDIAQNHGAKTPTEALELFKGQLKSKAKIIYPWGDKGATAFDFETGQCFNSPACPPENGIVDTLGAGDTFNGSVIGALNSGMDLGSAIRLGCKVAGAKVGQRGFAGLKDLYSSGMTSATQKKD